MKIFLGLILCMALVIPTALATARGDDITIEQITKCTTYSAEQVSVTDSNTQVTFSRDTKAIYIENIGANELFFDPSDGVAVADTSHAKLEPGDNRSLTAYATVVI